jgi:hypothetical protein
MTIKQTFWKVVHNAVAHPLLAIDDLIRAEWTVDFHDWTSDLAWPPEEGGGYDPNNLEVRLGEHREHMDIAGHLLTDAGLGDEFRAILKESEMKVDELYEERVGSK